MKNSEVENTKPVTNSKEQKQTNVCHSPAHCSKNDSVCKSKVCGKEARIEKAENRTESILENTSKKLVRFRSSVEDLIEAYMLSKLEKTLTSKIPLENEPTSANKSESAESETTEDYKTVPILESTKHENKPETTNDHQTSFENAVEFNTLSKLESLKSGINPDESIESQRELKEVTKTYDTPKLEPITSESTTENVAESATLSGFVSAKSQIKPELTEYKTSSEKAIISSTPGEELVELEDMSNFESRSEKVLESTPISKPVSAKPETKSESAKLKTLSEKPIRSPTLVNEVVEPEEISKSESSGSENTSDFSNFQTLSEKETTSYFPIEVPESESEKMSESGTSETESKKIMESPTVPTSEPTKSDSKLDTRDFVAVLKTNNAKLKPSGLEERFEITKQEESEIMKKGKKSFLKTIAEKSRSILKPAKAKLEPGVSGKSEDESESETIQQSFPEI